MNYLPNRRCPVNHPPAIEGLPTLAPPPRWDTNERMQTYKLQSKLNYSMTKRGSATLTYGYHREYCCFRPRRPATVLIR